MQTQPDPQLAQATAMRDARTEAVVAAALAARQRRRRPVARWTRLAMRALPRVLGIATVGNGLLGLVAVLAPLLRVVLGSAATAPLYTAYSAICPQRPTHTWFIAGQPMAMEQRMVAMYLASGLVGLLYTSWPLLRRPLATIWMLLGIAPALLDVAASSAGLRPSTAASRLLTGTLAATVVVWWAYPRFDAMLRRTHALLALRQAADATPRR